MRMTYRSGYWFLPVLVIFVSLFLSDVLAMTPEEVPEPLKPWVDWVLDDETALDCPHLYNNGRVRRCAWPTALELDILDASATFDQQWRVFGESRITLPGNADLWPQEVTVNGESVPVLESGNRPQILLDPGTYHIRGSLFWTKMPDAVMIPRETALVNVTLKGRPVGFPDIDKNGRLWLKRQEAPAGEEKAVGDRFDIQVFRRIVDEVPMKVVTAIDLEVSGQQREAVLQGALPDDFIPMELRSSLPARLEADGRLRLQLRPGTWHIEVDARSRTELTSLPLTENPAPWPKEEVWAFNGQNHLRLVEVRSVPAIDPRQTTLPAGWQRFPAYRMKPGDTMVLAVIRRGDPDPAPDQLSLTRHLWLDFDGKGFTIQDRIAGTMTQGWRLSTGAQMQLGQVLIDGTPQFITTLPDSDSQGVEVRRGKLSLTADLRYEQGAGDLPATGWAHDFQKASAVLHLPPGWKVLSMGGVDNVPETWFKQWTLMDLFLVLMIAVSFFKLWGWPWGMLSLAMAVLTWHEPGAPRYVWLNILAAIALIRVVPAGKFRVLITTYRNAAFVVLILLSVPFMVNQVKNGLFPQLEKPWLSIGAGSTRQAGQEPFADGIMARSKAAVPMEMKSAARDRPAQTFESLDMESGMQQDARLDQIDPAAMVQTGPGIPSWNWRTMGFGWNGPVKQDQRIHLVLLSPEANLVLNMLRVLFLVILSLFLIKRSFAVKGKNGIDLFGKTAAMIFVCFLCLAPSMVRAAFPGPELLNDLKEKLLKPPDCLPECARISRMAMDVTDDALTIRMEVHAGGSVDLPLPGDADLWISGRVTVGEEESAVLYRSDNDEIRIRLKPGIHQVLMAGRIEEQDRIILPLHLKPARVTFTARGWNVKGIKENGLPENQIRLERIQRATEKKAPAFQETSEFPVFVRVTRTLRLGLDWEVQTVVTRLSLRQEALVLEIPLIAGESVTTDGFTVKDGKVLVNMAPRRRQVIWRSVLEKQPEIVLTAAETSSWVEVWKADVSALWHTAYSGLAVVHHQDSDGHWLPEWRPWPGESVTIHTIRPVGVKGQTLTINGSSMTVSPGRRATDIELAVSLNSSRGGQHTLTLPEHSELQKVLINNQAQPIRMSNRQIRIPVTPGGQNVRLLFRSRIPISNLFVTPAVDLNAPSVNHRLNVRMGHDRWVLWMSGPRLGPAVLFWGLLLVVFILATGLGRIRLMPLKAWQWFLLLIGLSQTSVLLGIIVVGWLLVLGMRMNLGSSVKDYQFNLIQIGLVLSTLIALAVLFFAVQKGLLGLPEMQISGNQSTAHNLNWFQDRMAGPLPVSRIVSVPLLVYRIIMLLWALWLAFSLLGWLRWGWRCFSANGLWRKVTLRRKRRAGPFSETDFEDGELEITDKGEVDDDV